MKSTALRLSLLAALAALAGCAGAWNGSGQALSVAEEHPISVDSQVVTLTMALDPSNPNLSSVDQARLRAFADAYLNSGHGPLTITAPSGAASDGAAADRASNIRAYLHSIGVSHDAMTGSNYRAADDRSRDLILSYTHYVATPPVCGVWQGVKARDYANLRSPNYGCAAQNNLAAMVADPRDLVAPADSTPADASARVRMMGRYRQGEVTSSATDSAIQAEIAE